MGPINVDSGQLTLASAPVGSHLIVQQLRTEPDFTKRLGAIGLRPGVHVHILRRASGGARVLAVGGARIALGQPVLRAILAEEVGG